MTERIEGFKDDGWRLQSSSIDKRKRNGGYYRATAIFMPVEVEEGRDAEVALSPISFFLFFLKAGDPVTLPVLRRRGSYPYI